MNHNTTPRGESLKIIAPSQTPIGSPFTTTVIAFLPTTFLHPTTFTTTGTITVAPNEDRVDFTFEDTDPPTNQAYYYVRLTQQDGTWPGQAHTICLQRRPELWQL